MGSGKTYMGRPDQMFESGEWDHLGEWVDVEENNIEWIFFAKLQKHSNEWRTYKVVANGRVLKKANYWFARNERTGDFGFTKDLAAMMAHRPSLYKKTLAFCQQVALSSHQPIQSGVSPDR